MSNARLEPTEPSAVRPSRSSAPTVVHMQFEWPRSNSAGLSDNFFLGAWHPSRPLRVDVCGTPPTAHIARTGRNWILLSAASPSHPPGTGLVHQAEDGSSAVAFRGYVLPQLHSYSADADIVTYWGTRLAEEHNGVFAAAVIGPGGERLTLLSDILGIGPLYYRVLADVILFSTNPRFLAADRDRPDLVAWRSIAQTSWIVGDRSLTVDVNRTPPGQALCWRRDGTQDVVHARSLPRGTRPVNERAVSEVEEAFQQAMDRCLRLNGGNVVLPLSSGFDSRRILAAMLRRQVNFHAVTYRALQKQHRDLDARFAGEMARDFAFPHATLDSTNLEQYAVDDRIRRSLVDAETREHSWAIQLMQWLPAKPGFLFDGVAGDILGDPVGWSAHTGLAVESRSFEDELDAIALHSITRDHDSVLSSDQWPSAADLRQDVKAYLRQFLPRDNIGEIAFLLLRQRRVIAPWTQQLAPPGYVPLCPYLDLDYLRLLLDFRSTEKHATKFQRACLREFWPEFYRYPGNRDIPEDTPPGSAEVPNAQTLRCQATLLQEIGSDGLSALRRLLTMRGQFGLSLSRRSSKFSLRDRWYLMPLMELVSREVRRTPCWKLVAA